MLYPKKARDFSEITVSCEPSLIYSLCCYRILKSVALAKRTEFMWPCRIHFVLVQVIFMLLEIFPLRCFGTLITINQTLISINPFFLKEGLMIDSWRIHGGKAYSCALSVICVCPTSIHRAFRTGINVTKETLLPWKPLCSADKVWF